MTDHHELHIDRPNDDVTRTLRKVYEAPAEESYWRGLESRILSGLTRGAASLRWWDELGRLMRPALVAAAVVLAAAGVAMLRAEQVEQEETYEAMLTPTALPVETAVRPVLQEQREATFRYLMTPR
jgi:hypothetical protein